MDDDSEAWVPALRLSAEQFAGLYPVLRFKVRWRKFGDPRPPGCTATIQVDDGSVCWDVVP